MKIVNLALAVCFAVALVGCNDDRPPQDTYVASVPQQRTCQVFYDSEEKGMVTQCFDIGNRSCFTLYEPDGDTEYYCNGEKIWEIEPDDMWAGWDFDSKKHKRATRPKYVTNSIKPKKTPPANYKYVAPNAKTNSKAALAAASKQTKTATPTTKPKVNLTKTPTKPKVNLTKTPTKPKVVVKKKTPPKK